MSDTSPAFYTASCCTMKLSHPSQCFQPSSSFLPLHPAATLHCVFSHRVLVCSSGSQPRGITRVYTIWGASRPSLTNNSEGEPTPGIENFCLVTHGFLEQHHQTHLPSNCFFCFTYFRTLLQNTSLSCCFFMGFSFCPALPAILQLSFLDTPLYFSIPITLHHCVQLLPIP